MNQVKADLFTSPEVTPPLSSSSKYINRAAGSVMSIDWLGHRRGGTGGAGMKEPKTAQRC